MLKKLWLDIVIFFRYLMAGLRAADNEMTTGAKNLAGEGTSIEKKQEADNLYAALLRGEVTQEVREARHEMYYAERRSKDYIYSGGGHATKKNDVFDYTGNVEKSDGQRILLVQDNYQDQATIEEYGIDVGKVEDYGSGIYGTIKGENIAKKEFTFKVKREFIPKFRIEEFIKKVVVKEFGEKRIFDIYVSKYPVQFDRRSRMFVNMINEIYEGNFRSEIIDFDTVSFVTKDAYGSDDLKLYSFNQFEFHDIIDYDGNYVLRFVCTPVDDGVDLIAEFYDEATEQKSKDHAPRENVTVSMEDALEIARRESYDAETAGNLIKQLNEGK